MKAIVKSRNPNSGVWHIWGISNHYNITPTLGVTKEVADWENCSLINENVAIGKNILLFKDGTFPVDLLSGNGVYVRAYSIAGVYAVVEKVFSVPGTFRQTLFDGTTEKSWNVTVLNRITQIPSSYSRLAVYNNPLHIAGGQYVIMEGSGMYAVNAVKVSGVNLEFWKVNDNFLVFKTKPLAATGTYVVAIEDKNGNQLDSFSLNFNLNSNFPGETYYFIEARAGSWFMTSLFFDWNEDANPVAAIRVGNNFFLADVQESLIENYNRVDKSFMRVVRDRDGVVVPYADYTVHDTQGEIVFSGKADKDGVIRFSLRNLPNVFVIKYHSYKVVPQEETVVKK